MTHQLFRTFRPVLISAFVALISPAMALAQNSQVLNMRDADIRAFINDVSMMTGRTFIVDPRVQGKVTVVSQQPLKGEWIHRLADRAWRLPHRA